MFGLGAPHATTPGKMSASGVLCSPGPSCCFAQAPVAPVVVSAGAHLGPAHCPSLGSPNSWSESHMRGTPLHCWALSGHPQVSQPPRWVFMRSSGPYRYRCSAWAPAAPLLTMGRGAHGLDLGFAGSFSRLLETHLLARSFGLLLPPGSFIASAALLMTGFALGEGTHSISALKTDLHPASGSGREKHPGEVILAEGCRSGTASRPVAESRGGENHSTRTAGSKETAP
ncbi:hypothetical protein NDU88_001633 [Pleurodeles waltl]|uniref:Uncharacterized protein n=1 Tax=Pleurodeles waltl TaxID=8319 RepID=A0AAV7WP72_PLEWA|nr:hypothetical protein NDU88_001633 [Pleurodeles waltl]